MVGYRVFRNGTQVATSPTTAYQDTGLTPATTYAYAVSAYDAAGNDLGPVRDRERDDAVTDRHHATHGVADRAGSRERP